MTEVSAIGTPEESRDFLKDSQKINAQTLAYTALAADRGKVILYTGAGGVDLDLTAAATLGDGWWTLLVNASAANITIDPDGAELINGAASLVVEPNQRVYIYCTASTFYSAAEPKTPLPLSGGTMTGTLTLAGDPVNPLEAATKQYADSIAAGIIFEDPAYAATTADLNAVQAGAGVGATLTNNGALAAFSVDGVSPPINSRILVKDQTLPEENGCYDLTTVGSGAVAWVLTRSTNYDQAAEIVPGTLFIVENGTINALSSWVETATVVTVDTDPIQFSQFSANPASFAPSNAQFLVLATNATLTDERVATPNGGLDSTDNGAGSTYEMFTNFIESAQPGAYTIVAADRGTFVNYFGAGGDDIDITAAATLGDGFWCAVINSGAGSMTLTPTAPDEINGVASITVEAGQSVVLFCNGNDFWTVGQYTAPDTESANRALSNLAGVSINESLISDTDITDDLGSPAIRWDNIYAQNISAGDTIGDVLTFAAWDTDGAVSVPFFTVTSGDTPTGVLSGDVTGTTQAPLTNDTTLATTAFVFAATGGGGGANTALSNLAGVSINTTLVSDTDVTDNLGTQAIRWNNIYAATLQSGDTATDTIRIGSWDVDGAAFVPWFTCTSANTPTGVLNDGVTATTQAASDGTTKVATCAYVDNQVSSIGATRALDNLNAVAVNISITPAVDDSINLGSVSKRWAQTYSDELITGNTGLQIKDTDGSHYFTVAMGSNATANRTVTLTTGDANRTLDISAANTTVSAFGATLVDDADAATARGTLELGSIATQASNNVTITGGSITGITDLAVADGGSGASSFTAYAVICGGTTSTNPLQSIAGVGTSGQVLTSNGAGALPTFQTASGGAGSWVLLANDTASADATIDFEQCFSDTYEIYVLMYENEVPATTNTNPRAQFGTGGTPTWQATSYGSGGCNGTTGSTANEPPSVTTALNRGDDTNQTNTSTSNGGGMAIIRNVRNATNHKAMNTRWGMLTGGATAGGVTEARWQNATVVTSLRLLYSSGNISTGTYWLYGIKLSQRKIWQLKKRQLRI